MSVNNPKRNLNVCSVCGKRAAYPKAGLCQEHLDQAHNIAKLDALLFDAAVSGDHVAAMRREMSEARNG